MTKFRKANTNGKGLSHPAVKVLVALNIILLGGGLYIYYHEKSNDQFTIAEQETNLSGDTITHANAVVVNQQPTAGKPSVKKLKPNDNFTASSNSSEKSTSKTSPPIRELGTSTILIQAKNNNSINRYTVAKGLAHFHNSPDPSTKRKAFINHWNKAILTPLDEQNGFIYIIYTNHLGQTSKGWLQIKDLQPIAGK